MKLQFTKYICLVLLLFLQNTKTGNHYFATNSVAEHATVIINGPHVNAAYFVGGLSLGMILMYALMQKQQNTEVNGWNGLQIALVVSPIIIFSLSY